MVRSTLREYLNADRPLSSSQGSGPFEIDYIIAWGTGSETKTASYQSSGRYSIDIQVPSALLAGETGQGTFSVTFATIKDSKDCVTRPRRATVSYEVKTTHVSSPCSCGEWLVTDHLLT